MLLSVAVGLKELSGAVELVKAAVVDVWVEGVYFFIHSTAALSQSDAPRSELRSSMISTEPEFIK